MSTKRVRFLLAVVAVALSAGVVPAQSPHDWAVHDVDRPQPPIVTPGTFSTQDTPGQPPSDAIVLFDEDLGAFTIEDLQSTNGTKVNGKRVRGATLSPGDLIQIGHTQFEFLTDPDPA